VKTRIYPIKLGISNCFILQGEGVVLVDCGVPNQRESFVRQLQTQGISPQDIRLIVLTHGHYDHTGSAAAIKSLTGAPIALHRADAEAVQKGETLAIHGFTGWGRMVAFLGRVANISASVPPLPVDLILGDEGLSLEPYGIAGQVIYTPGHTEGSVSILLEGGHALVGDLAMAMPPLRFRPGLSTFGSDMETLKASARKLLDLGARVIYPSHGAPFSAEVLRRACR
jgi:glyoxylase-like metal-dependent hydrolase (beta-lactamase superfamily II)